MKSITVEAAIENIPLVTEFVESELEAADYPPKLVMTMDVALDELCSNVARYAYEGRPGPLTVQVTLREDPEAVEITLVDEGVPYNPLEHADPEAGAAADESVIGGMGILIVKRTMTRLNYTFREGKNILTMIKNRTE